MTASVTEYRVFGLSLLQQVLVGLVLGIAAGYLLGPAAGKLQVFGTVFINLIKMLVIPLIFLALVSGVTSMHDSASFTRVGLKGVAAYLLTSAIAVILGIGMGALLKPGLGVQFDPTLISGAALPASATEAPPSIGQFFLGLIPTNIFRSMAEDHFLQVIVFAIFFGAVINKLGPKVERARDLLHEFAQIVFKMIELVVRLAPLAVFGFMAWSVGTQGIEIILTLFRLVLTVLAACVVQYLVFGILISVFGRISPMPFYRKMFATQMMAFSTSSSKATLTTAMAELQKMGVSPATTNFVMPLGACINMDGTAIYLGICAMFFSQLFGIHLGAHEYIVLVLTATLGSIGAAGIPSGSIIFMGMVLNSIGLPIDGIGLILGIDRMLDMVRTTINITGDAAITLIVDRSEKSLDERAYFDR